MVEKVRDLSQALSRETLIPWMKALPSCLTYPREEERREEVERKRRNEISVYDPGRSTIIQSMPGSK